MYSNGAVALLVFFLSGFAALIDQVIWQRLLVTFSGADVHSVTIIVTAFMSGLGMGSLAGGWVADRMNPRVCLWGFGVAELCIGGFALFSKTLYYDVLYLQYPNLAATPVIEAGVLLASLLWPTFFMGLSLPLLARALTGSLAAAGRVVGSLYGCNTLGAAAGAFVGTWVLMPRFGLERSLWIAAAANFACAAATILLARQGAAAFWRAAEEQPDRVEESAPPITEALSFRTWALVYGLTGFVALALEIAWFRILGVMLKSTAFTFGTLLGVYLGGLGLGAALGSRRVARSSSPGATFLLLQCAAPLYVGWSIVVLMASISAGHPIKLVRYLGGYEPVDVRATIGLLREIGSSGIGGLTPFFDFLVLYLLIPGLLIGPPTLLMGMSFPYLQKASQIDLRGLGRRLGILLASNIVGSALGAMLTGWLLLPRLGTAVTLKLLVGLGALLAVPLLVSGTGRTTSPRSWTRAMVSASVLLVAASTIGLMPDGQTLWARLHTAPPGQVLFAEDGAGLSLLKADRPDFSGEIGVFVNGIGQSWIPYGSVHTALGILPALIHPAPADVAVIGLGSGDTAYAAAARPEVRRLVSVEIIGVQRETLLRLAVVRPYPALTALLSDPRIEHRAGDGRAYIQQAGRLFDIIEADALRPGSAYSGNLYSREYFELLRRHLTPQGLAVTWAPTERIQRTFVSVFPHVLAFHDIYLGSSAPIPLDADVVEGRALAVRSYFEAAGIDVVDLVRRYVAVPVRIGPHDARAPGDLNTDIFPRDEFALPF